MTIRRRTKRKLNAVRDRAGSATTVPYACWVEVRYAGRRAPRREYSEISGRRKRRIGTRREDRLRLRTSRVWAGHVGATNETATRSD